MLSKTLELYKNAYAGHSREVWTLAILTLVNRIGTMVVPFLTVYLTAGLGFSMKEAGLLASSFGIGSLLGTFSGGRISDRLGPNTVIIGSLFFGGLMLILLQFARGFYPIMACIFATAMFGEAYRPAITSSVGDYVPKSAISRSMALIRLAMNLGVSIAPFVGGFLATSMGYPWLFWTDGLTCMAAAFVLWQAAKRWKRQHHEEEAPSPAQIEYNNAHPLSNTPFITVLLMTVMMGFAFTQWFQSVPVFMNDIMQLDERYIGIVIACNGLVVVLFEMPFVHWVEKKGYERRAMGLGLACIGASFLFLLLPHSLAWCFLGVLFVSLGEVFYFPLNVSMAIKLSTPSKRGAYMGFYSMSWSLVHIISPSGGLLIASQFGFPALWLALAALMSICIVLHFKRSWG